ncbi:hypothetical protein AKG98_3781 [Moritella sp. JT01]|uniref:hypothetical protein n=1 Tax=Moritella sp. JT01 TaxID=756698 RepID=UPI00079CB77E|nr:hypothetical protein [Moritella sp. JT01]KXO12586.1 hypothetical protein AKG98_3781 [Moritella sp. JT01]
MKSIKSLVVTTLLSVLLTACGGGGDKTTPVKPTTPTKEKQFKLDRTLSGLYGPSDNALLPSLANVTSQDSPDAKSVKDNIQKVLNVVDNAAETIIEVYAIVAFGEFDRYPTLKSQVLRFNSGAESSGHNLRDISGMVEELKEYKYTHDSKPNWVHPKLGNISAKLIATTKLKYMVTVIAENYYINDHNIGQVEIKLAVTKQDEFIVKLKTVNESGEFDGRYQYTFRNNKERMVAYYNNNDDENSFYTKHDYNSQAVDIGKLEARETKKPGESLFKLSIDHTASYDVSNNTLIRN